MSCVHPLAMYAGIPAGIQSPHLTATAHVHVCRCLAQDEGFGRGSEFPTIEEYVGNTPLVRLQRLPGKTSNVILAKLEGNNPAGSVKDRCVLGCQGL